jgi:hypothetical protein
VPDLAANATYSAQNQRDNQRTSGKTEPDWMRQSWKYDGHCSECDAQDNANEKRDKMCLVEFLE